ncbi:hypothetical protein GGP41_004720 [Bipolaris sorokiniana]|uniref:Uncharacterized protein n=1 Tax=Cochliobolus sativus TaxID=45130 RepID=A0A8H6DSS1_COCSA|nr:hypothetical protein GGP41_004720 [Bipolaris sorokiniana]
MQIHTNTVCAILAREGEERNDVVWGLGVYDVSIFLFPFVRWFHSIWRSKKKTKREVLQCQAIPSFSRLSPASCISIYRYDVKDTHSERINCLVSFSSDDHLNRLNCPQPP